MDADVEAVINAILNVQSRLLDGRMVAAAFTPDGTVIEIPAQFWREVGVDGFTAIMDRPNSALTKAQKQRVFQLLGQKAPVGTVRVILRGSDLREQLLH